MSVSRPCPDDLLARSRAGTLSVLERQRLDAHLSLCEDCATALSVGDAFDRSAAPLAGDEAMIARIAAATAVRAVENPPLRSLAARRSRARAARTRGWLAAAVIAAARTASAATWVHYRSVRAHGSVPVAPSRSAPVLHREVPHPLQPVATAMTPTPPAPIEAPVAPVVPATAIAPEEPSASHSAATHVVAHRPAPPVPTAAELFAAANQSRRDNDPHASVLYLELERRYPSSSEAALSYVSNGRFELERGDAAAALSAFNGYLAAHAGGPLAAEALFGRASALQHLGRADDERAAWNELLERFPDSVYAARARRRIDQLR